MVKAGIEAEHDAEFRLRRLMRLHNVLSKTSEAIMRAHDKHELYSAVCRIIVEEGLLRMVFVAEVDIENKTARPVASFGVDIAEVSPMQPWHGPELNESPLSAACFPLKIHGFIVGVLILYADEMNYFLEDEIGLIVTVASYLSFALEALEKDQDRKRSEELLRQSEEQFRNMFISTATGIATSTPQGKFLRVNDAYCRMLGYTESELQSLDFSSIIHPDDLGLNIELRNQVLQGARDSFVMEKRYVKKNEEVVWTWHTISAVRSATGEITMLVAVAENITERKQAEEHLAANEALLRQFLRHTPAAVAMFDIQMHYIQASERWIEDYHLTGQKIIGKSHYEIFPELPPEWKNIHQRVLAGAVDRCEEVAFVRADGSTQWIQWEVRPWHNTAGGVGGLIMFTQVITERKRVEEQLQWKTAFLEAQVYSALDGILVVDSNGMKILQNQKMIDLWNIPKEIADEEEHHRRFEWIKNQVKNPELFAEKVRYLYDNPDEISRDKLELLNGKFIDRYTSSVKSKDGKYYGRIWIYRDVTEGKHTEDRFRRLVESNAQAVFFWNTKGEITGSNDAFLNLTQYNREDLEAGLINWASMTPPEYTHRDKSALNQLATTGICATYEKEWIRKDGTLIPILLGAAMFEDKPEEGVCFVVDLSEQRRLEEQLQQSQKMEAVGQLAGGIAHDFNNLLTIINGYTEVLLSGATDDKIRQKLELIKEAGDQSAGLTQQLLAFSRKQVLAPTTIHLNELVIKMHKMLARIIGEDIELITHLHPQLQSVRADSSQMEQIMLNLVVNARDAMTEGGRLTIKTDNIELDKSYTATHQDLEPGEYVMLSICDTGSGISEETKRHIFEPFFTTKDQGKGTGLGLAVVHGIVKQSGGDIELYSELGIGTCFKIYLPGMALQAGAHEVSDDAIPSPRGTETILLVEDARGVRKFAKDMLEDHGYTVLEADGGKEALSLCKEHKKTIHLLLTDVVMPQIGGRELSEKLLALHPEMKVIFMSGYTDDAVVRQGILHEQVNFLQKPFSLRALTRKVRDVLG